MTAIASSNDDSILIYDCESGLKKRQVNSKKYGVDRIQFTHSPTTAIHCSRKMDDTIRYLSLNDNKYIRYFPGHTKTCVVKVLLFIYHSMQCNIVENVAAG